ncbi:MAG: glycosyltransferase family 4 protein [Synechococcales bacterium]|nr:glycosyltransferase family 4 protein [Synechococcales bacterium]
MSKYVFLFLQVFSCEGGIQSYVRAILQAYGQTESVDRADVFLLRDGREVNNPYAGDRLRFHYCQTKPESLGRIRFALAFALYLLRERPDRVFCGHIHLAPLVQRLCQLCRISYTVLTYGKEVWTPLPPAKQVALQQADRIWTISRYSRDRLCSANAVSPDRVDLLPCAIDAAQFQPQSPDPDLQQRYGLEQARVVMTVARLWSGDRYKGVDVTLRALPQIAQVFADVKYLIIGRGDDQPRLAQLAQELGVGDRVVFAGYVPTADLPQHYALADAYVMPSQEGFGIVYLEAMACGIPVLSGDADGSADPLQDGILGWQVPHRDPDAVAMACIAMLKGEDPRCQGAWLRSQVVQAFGQETFRDRLFQRMGAG